MPRDNVEIHPAPLEYGLSLDFEWAVRSSDTDYAHVVKPPPECRQPLAPQSPRDLGKASGQPVRHLPLLPTGLLKKRNRVGTLSEHSEVDQ
jgi:hypothetical protein